jgi:hypothetical protein
MWVMVRLIRVTLYLQRWRVYTMTSAARCLLGDAGDDLDLDEGGWAIRRA